MFTFRIFHYQHYVTIVDTTVLLERKPTQRVGRGGMAFVQTSSQPHKDDSKKTVVVDVALRRPLKTNTANLTKAKFYVTFYALHSD